MVYLFALSKKFEHRKIVLKYVFNKNGRPLKSLPFVFSGGDDGDRTHDLSIANAALSQLSYIPSALLFYDYGFSCQVEQL